MIAHLTARSVCGTGYGRCRAEGEGGGHTLWPTARTRWPAACGATLWPTPRLMILEPPHRNLIAQAHNGSGKTTCFVLGMLSLVDPDLKEPQALCICPTRELAVQVAEEFQSLQGKKGLSIETVYGGTDIEKQAKLLQRYFAWHVPPAAPTLASLTQGSAQWGHSDSRQMGTQFSSMLR